MTKYNGKIEVWFDGPDGDEQSEVLTYPLKWEICYRCSGTGGHVNPAIDGHGLTAEEWHGPDWDDESRAGYMNGDYDVPCHAGCNNGKIRVPDRDRCTKEALRAIEEREEDEAHYNAEVEAERRAGC